MGRNKMRKMRLERLIAAAAGAILIGASGPAFAGPVTIQGDDIESKYESSSELIRFNTNGDPSGIATTIDAYSGTGFEDLTDNTTRSWLNIQLGPTQNPIAGDGVSPFDPASTGTDGNVKRARFEGVDGMADFAIFKVDAGLDGIVDPTESNSPTDFLLLFDIEFIDVTGATKRETTGGGTIVIDPDGSITLGDPSINATSSRLTIIGGSLANQFGGIGTEARLSVKFETLDPAILSNSDFRGYLGSDFTSGVGATPVVPTRWELTIVPEPGTAALVGLGLAGLSFVRRRGSRR